MNTVETDNHKVFLKALDESQDAVWYVARWLNGRGYNVKVNASSKAKTHGEWKDHTDNGDLEISQRVEVKRLSVDFTSREDWPFGSKFIVCGKHTWDRATPKPYAHIIVSRDGRYAAISMGKDRPRWRTESRTDSRFQGVTRQFYFAPLETISFVALGDGMPVSNGRGSG